MEISTTIASQSIQEQGKVLRLIAPHMVLLFSRLARILEVWVALNAGKQEKDFQGGGTPWKTSCQRPR